MSSFNNVDRTASPLGSMPRDETVPSVVVALNDEVNRIESEVNNLTDHVSVALQTSLAVDLIRREEGVINAVNLVSLSEQIGALREEVTDLKVSIDEAKTSSIVGGGKAPSRCAKVCRALTIASFALVSIIALAALVVLLVCLFGQLPTVSALIAGSSVGALLGANTLTTLAIISGFTCTTSLIVACMTGLSRRKHVTVSVKEEELVALRTAVKPPKENLVPFSEKQ